MLKDFMNKNKLILIDEDTDKLLLECGFQIVMDSHDELLFRNFLKKDGFVYEVLIGREMFREGYIVSLKKIMLDWSSRSHIYRLNNFSEEEIKHAIELLLEEM